MTVSSPKTHILIWSIGEDITIEYDVSIVQTRFHLTFQRLIELDFGVVQSFQITDALRVKEGYMLFLSIIYPEDKVWIEIAGLKKTYALTALVAKKINFLTFQYIIAMCIVIVSDGSDKSRFAYIQCHRRYFDKWFMSVLINKATISILVFLTKTEQRIEQMLVET